MNEKELAEWLRYSNPKELYVVTWNNLLKLLFCPFKVLVLQDVGDLKTGQEVWVEEVKVTMELKTVYKIKGQFYYYHHFEIIVDD
ncbi:hypothetical protein [Aestuariivivens insulae]|uniref:hypothetical protein n=1 Tax=Aestuariivivens insulae TaxID=1621988 RepID=UPI001F56B435|nr:hypothetical protein [Aestuariivivens insulae]